MEGPPVGPLSTLLREIGPTRTFVRHETIPLPDGLTLQERITRLGPPTLEALIGPRILTEEQVGIPDPGETVTVVSGVAPDTRTEDTTGQGTTDETDTEPFGPTPP